MAFYRESQNKTRSLEPGASQVQLLPQACSCGRRLATWPETHTGYTHRAYRSGMLGLAVGPSSPQIPAPHVSWQHGLFSMGAYSEGAMSLKDTLHPRTKEKPQQNSRRGQLPTAYFWRESASSTAIRQMSFGHRSLALTG